jgi:biopolymer transport protein ExbD
MRYPRNVRMFHGPVDAAGFLSVAFLIILFLSLHSLLVFTPGARIKLPTATGFSGASNPTVSVALDRAGRLYFRNQLTTEEQLAARLAEVVRQAAGTPLTLVVQADQDANYAALVRLGRLATDAGFQEVLLGTRPGLLAPGK